MDNQHEFSCIFTKKFEMKKIVLLIALAMFMSCTTEADKLSETFNLKMTEAIAVHDEVMPKMGQMSGLMKQLESQMDSLNQSAHKAAIKDLQVGHDKMMDWMKALGDDFTRDEIQGGLQTKDIDSIKLKIKAIEKSSKDAVDMKNHINNAIAKAEELLD